MFNKTTIKTKKQQQQKSTQKLFAFSLMHKLSYSGEKEENKTKKKYKKGHIGTANITFNTYTYTHYGKTKRQKNATRCV